MGDQVLAFGGKTHAVQGTGLRTRGMRHRGQDVGILDKRQRGHVARTVLLDLLVTGMGRSPVGHRGRGDENRGAVGHFRRRIEHLLRRLHIEALHAARRGQMHRAGNQRDLGTGRACGTRHRKAHLAARVIGDAAHRVNGLERRSGRHQDMVADQLLGGQIGRQVFQNLGGLEHPAIAGLAAGLRAVADTQHHRTILSDLRHVALGGGVQPHFPVHGGREQQGYPVDRACQAEQAQQLVRAALHQPGNEVGAARRYQ